MNALTYKNIKTIIATFASNHLQIANEHQGGIYEIDEIKNVKGFYLIWDVIDNLPLVSAPGQKQGIGGQIFTIETYILDYVSEINTTSNIDDVKNEAHLIAHDMLSVFQNHNKSGYDDLSVDMTLGDDWSIQFTEERASGLYSGVVLTFSLKTNFNYQRCLTPMTGVASEDQIISSAAAQSGILSYPIIMTSDYELPVGSANTPAYIMINRSGSDLTLTTADASTIEGESSVTISDGASFWLYYSYDNTNWYLI